MMLMYMGTLEYWLAFELAAQHRLETFHNYLPSSGTNGEESVQSDGDTSSAERQIARKSWHLNSSYCLVEAIDVATWPWVKS
jgi:hypothetical protein